MKHCRCVQCYIPKTQLLVDADAVEFFLHCIPFLAFTLKDFLLQATTDIMSTLLNPPMTIAPTMQAGDPAYNAMLNITKLLKRSNKILQLKDIENALLPRVMNNKSIINDTLLLRVPSGEAKDIDIILFDNEDELLKNQIDMLPFTVQALTLTALPKNVQHNNATQNYYNLYSKQYLINYASSNLTRCGIVEYVFSHHNFVNNIYNENSKKEILDSLLQGKNSQIWTRSLSNE